MIPILRQGLAAILLFTAALSAWGQGGSLEGVKLEPSAQVGGAALQLNGAGVRVRVVFKVYVAALYVPQRSSDPATLLSQQGPRRVAITMLRNVDADTFAGALVDGLKANHDATQLAALKAPLDALTATLKAAGEAKKGDVIHLDFLPGTGTRVVINGQAKGEAIAGDAFYTALLRIWIGDKPVDDGLRKSLLGA